jgi:PEGA domain
MRFRLLSCLLAVCMAMPVDAAAQPAASPPKSDAKTDQARELFIKGAALYDQGQYERAEAAFLASWSLKRHYQIAGNLGRCEMKLGKYRNAAEHLAFFLKELPTSADPEERKRAQALFDEARAKVAAVAIRVDVDGAAVRVDGQAIGAAPLAAEVFVEPGKRTIEAARNGYQDAREVIDARAGASASVSLKLLPLAAASDRPKGPGEIAPAVVSAQPNRVVLAAGGAAAGAALLGGVVFTILANGKAGDADDKRDTIADVGGQSACLSATFKADCDELHGLRQSASTFTNVAGWAFIGAGVVGVGTLVYALTSSRKVASSAVQAAPLVTGHGGGLSLAGRW